MTVPLWTREARAPGGAPSQGRRLDVDLCVIGAGICGIAAALEAERRGLRVVVLERHALASGASSRNAGFLMRGAADHYADAVRRYGRDRAAMVWRWTEQNLALLRAEGIDSLAGYRAVPSCLAALNPSQHAELRESYDLMVADGFACDWQTRGTDSAWNSGRILSALINPHDASVNPVEMMRLLRSRLQADVHEQQEVHAIEDQGRRVCVRTADMLVCAANAMVCTNAYAGLLSQRLAGLVLPRRGQMLALRGAGLRLDASYYVNHGSEYLRQTPDGTIVVGGCRTYFADRERGYEDRTTEAVQSAIEAFARAMLGGPWEVVARWAGTMGFSPDGLPLVGALGEGGRAWFCGGFTGHGMSMAFRTAKMAVGAMLTGEENPFPLDRFGTGAPV